jgi:hypothetical protein
VPLRTSRLQCPNWYLLFFLWFDRALLCRSLTYKLALALAVGLVVVGVVGVVGDAVMR